MFLKYRKESKELLLFRHLFFRNALSTKDKYYYRNLESGFEGELIFDEWLKPLRGELIFLSDLTFEFNNSHFQIDSLLISPKTIYLIEVKNYEGDYYIEGNKWYSLSKKEIKNPLIQMQRAESLLRQLFQYHKINYYIEAYLVFVNPEFYLYETPINSPIIFPAQRNRFISKIKKNRGKLNSKSFAIANKLLSLHVDEAPFTKLPFYDFQEINKGVFCQRCRSTLTEQKQLRLLVCTNCKFKEGTEQAILRSINEFELLFPKNKITKASIYKWCNKVKSQRYIKDILIKHFKLVRCGKSSYYVRR